MASGKPGQVSALLAHAKAFRALAEGYLETADELATKGGEGKPYVQTMRDHAAAHNRAADRLEQRAREECTLAP